MHCVAIYNGTQVMIIHESCNKTYILDEQLHAMELCIYHGITIQVQSLDGEPMSQMCRCTGTLSWHGGDARMSGCGYSNAWGGVMSG
jgi:hypothetical protein